MSEPTTEAGRESLTDWWGQTRMSKSTIRGRIAAIEAEARADLARRIEARVRNECRYAAELELCPECAGVVLAIRDEAARP